MKLPNGYGSVYKLKGKRRRPFTAVVTTGKTKEGRILRKTLGYYATREEGLDALALYRKAPVEAESQQLTFKKVMDEFIKYRESHDKPIASNYMTCMKNLYPLNNMVMSSIRTRHLQGVIDELKDKPSTCTVTKSCMNMIFKYAIMEDYVQTNYATFVITPVVLNSKAHKPFTDEEIEELWKHTDDYAVRIALILIYTGMRAGELCLLKKDNIHLEERYIIGGIKTKAGINRTIPIAEKIVPILEYNDKLPSSSERINYLWRKSKIPALNNHISHDGRHTCETRLNNANVNLRIIQLIIGHSGGNSVDNIYTHKTTEQLIEAINKI
jgi:integrase